LECILRAGKQHELHQQRVDALVAYCARQEREFREPFLWDVPPSPSVPQKMIEVITIDDDGDDGEVDDGKNADPPLPKLILKRVHSESNQLEGQRELKRIRLHKIGKRRWSCA